MLTQLIGLLALMVIIRAFNPNLGPETTPADVAEGARRLWELVSPYKPVDYLCVRRELCAALPEGLPCPVLPIRLWLTYPWAAGPEPDAP